MTAASYEGRASGKVILFGEHAVVYAVPGIAAGIERGAHATARRAPEGARASLTLSGRRHEPESDLGRALAALLSTLPELAALDVQASADIPPGGGLGCSAALGVAIARAAERASSGGNEPDAATVIERALAWERVFHGNPSGIDTAAAAMGTFLMFERGVGTRPLSSPSDVWLAIGHSGAGASTKVMVEGVARIRERKPDMFDKFLGGVGAIVQNAKLAIDAGDARAIGQLMDMNQMLLAGVMVSTDTIESMCASARAAGALGAKLTGSGGGGCVIALGGVCERAEAGSVAELNAKRAAKVWQDAGFTAFETRISGAVRNG
jgi:mevalonate kinase